ncbi:MAG: hypothetical protein V4636_19990 [Pseudomonadota bacterium]
MTKKPAKIQPSRRVRALGIASLLRTMPKDGTAGGIGKTPATYWRNAGSYK